MKVIDETQAGPDLFKPGPGSTFLRAPSCDAQSEVVDWLLTAAERLAPDQMVEVTVYTERGPDGQWRGSGLVKIRAEGS